MLHTGPILYMTKFYDESHAIIPVVEIVRNFGARKLYIINEKILYHTENRTIKMKFQCLAILYLIALTMVTASYGNRLGNFLAYNRSSNIRRRSQSQNTRSQNVRNKICNVTTCIKCYRIFGAGGEQRMRSICHQIFTLKSCCPQKLLVRAGF